MLLITWAMRTPQAATNPWGTEIENGWKDLVVSSAPPPPPREAIEPVVKNRPLPVGFNTWQEHGARAASVEAPVEEPSFTAGDRRLWIIAGSLMAMATLVLGMLGLLTFGKGAAAVEPEATRTSAVVEPARTVTPAREANRAAVGVTAKASSPRVLKASSRTKHGRHHNKPLASR
ncbi:MAG: hypothetical protein JWM53_869 [bacterium]|nr:hypothetical protein [bacterium]